MNNIITVVVDIFVEGKYTESIFEQHPAIVDKNGHYVIILNSGETCIVDNMYHCVVLK